MTEAKVNMFNVRFKVLKKNNPKVIHKYIKPIINLKYISKFIILRSQI